MSLKDDLITNTNEQELETNNILLNEMPQNVKTSSYRYSKTRYIFLIFALLLRFGRNYSYDNPQALEDSLTDPRGSFALSNVNFNLLYGVYSFPNIILPFIGGLIVDKIGPRIGVLIFAFLLIVGQFFFFLGGILANFPLMIVGRLIFGFGAETECVTQNVLLAKWFGEKELAFALAMDVAVARIGGTLNSLLTPYFYSLTQQYFVPLFVGLMTCVFSWFCGVIICYMDQKADQAEAKNKEKSEPMSLRDLRKFNFSYWMLIINCMMTYGAFICFSSNGNDIFIKIFGISSNKAGLLLMISYLSSSLATPFLGFFADKYGKRVSLMIFSIILYILSLLVVIYLPTHYNTNMIILPLVLIGLSYAIYCSMIFPCVAMIVPKETIGTAFGLNCSMINVNLSISPLIFGVIHDSTVEKNGYFFAIVFVICLALFGLFSLVPVYLIDYFRKGKLEKKLGARSIHSSYSSFR